MQSNDPMLALVYAWEALVRRFGLAWMLLAGAGLVFVALRHKKADLLLFWPPCWLSPLS